MRRWVILIALMVSGKVLASSLLIPMDNSQRNHLKAYGLAFYTLQRNIPVDWLLNYRGGSFLIAYSKELASECKVRDVSVEILSDTEVNKLLNQIESPAVNMNLVRMERAPRIAVYSPKNEVILDETDAVILVLDYAEIPYDIIYDEQILKEDALLRYDWLHLHHEDFTGQVSKVQFRQSAQLEVKLLETTAAQLGYSRVSAMKYDVIKKIHAFCASGGYLFAMCSGAETFDIALAANGVDLENTLDELEVPLDYAKSLAFENYTLEPTMNRSFSTINVGGWGYNDSGTEFFTLFEFSAKWDVIPSILTQNHEYLIREFSGLTTAFNKPHVKPDVLILAENRQRPYVRYIYGELGNGHWTYYSGHDPEGGRGRGRGPTDLNLFPHSPGYRLILNNVLFPSAGKKKRKT
ncbi:MAG: asparagine synthetase B [Flammeovirgaceae bacterium]|nr:MAG: asparagine synthetase B [Flammeovirgaceae bacterium]